MVPLSKTKTVNTIAGNMTTSQMIVLRELRLPEFDKNRIIEEQKAQRKPEDQKQEKLLTMKLQPVPA